MDQLPTQERRSVGRHDANTIAPVEVCAEALQISLTAAATDISIMGIGLITALPLKIGTSVTLGRLMGAYGRSLPLTAEVRQVSKFPDKRWLLGCTFARPLTAEDILGLG